MNLTSFAERYRLRVRRDQCGDPVIPGHRGLSHLYFAGGELCLLVLDGPVALSHRWKALGAKKLWLADISRHPKTGRKVEDVKVTGIPLENAKLAIRLAKAERKRILTEDHRKALIEGGSNTRFQSVKTILRPSLDPTTGPRPGRGFFGF
jgi:hypothetical protein